jgi:hypothetical protein
VKLSVFHEPRAVLVVDWVELASHRLGDEAFGLLAAIATGREERFDAGLCARWNIHDVSSSVAIARFACRASA